MKKLFTLLFVSILAFGTASAQEITDEQLYKYALLNEVIDQMKSEISSVVNDMIKNQDGIDGKRYTELAKSGGEGANDFEKQFMDLVEKEKNERIDAIKEVNQILATKMLGDGGKVYKQIKAALGSDEAVKTRYEAIVEGMQSSVGE